jgi:O-antigen ligase
VRGALLDDGLGMVAETNGLGVGAGNAETRVRALADFPGVANLHNWWLEVLVVGGLVGFALYLLFYLTLLRGQARAARRSADPLVRYMSLAGALSLVGWILGSLGPSTAIHFAPMWIMFGLGMGALVLAAREREERPSAS